MKRGPPVASRSLDVAPSEEEKGVELGGLGDLEDGEVLATCLGRDRLPRLPVYPFSVPGFYSPIPGQRSRSRKRPDPFSGPYQEKRLPTLFRPISSLIQGVLLEVVERPRRSGEPVAVPVP